MKARSASLAVMRREDEAGHGFEIAVARVEVQHLPDDYEVLRFRALEAEQLAQLEHQLQRDVALARKDVGEIARRSDAGLEADITVGKVGVQGLALLIKLLQELPVIRTLVYINHDFFLERMVRATPPGSAKLI